jgi:hypothetical protein
MLMERFIRFPQPELDMNVVIVYAANIDSLGMRKRTSGRHGSDEQNK